MLRGLGEPWLTCTLSKPLRTGGGQTQQAHTCLLIYPYTGHRQIAIYWLDQGSHLNLSNVKGNKALRDFYRGQVAGVSSRCCPGARPTGNGMAMAMTQLLAAQEGRTQEHDGDLTQEQPAGEETQPRQAWRWSLHQLGMCAAPGLMLLKPPSGEP